MPRNMKIHSGLFLALFVGLLGCQPGNPLDVAGDDSSVVSGTKKTPRPSVSAVPTAAVSLPPGATPIPTPTPTKPPLGISRVLIAAQALSSAELGGSDLGMPLEMSNCLYIKPPLQENWPDSLTYVPVGKVERVLRPDALKKAYLAKVEMDDNSVSDVLLTLVLPNHTTIPLSAPSLVTLSAAQTVGCPALEGTTINASIATESIGENNLVRNNGIRFLISTAGATAAQSVFEQLRFEAKSDKAVKAGVQNYSDYEPSMVVTVTNEGSLPVVIE